MHILCFGQQNWDRCWTGKQQLLTRLAHRGHHVLYVDPEWAFAPLSARDTCRAILPVGTRFGLREIQERLYIFTYHYAPLLRWRLNRYRWVSGRVVRGLARALGFTQAVAISLRPDTARLVDAVEPIARLYYAVDEWTAFGQPEDEQQLWRSREEALLRQADVALCVSPRLHQRFLDIQPRSYVLENGADVEHFSPHALEKHAPHAALAALPPPRLGFVGQVDDRLDQDLLVTIARARRDWQIVLAGRVRGGTDVSRLEAESNIHLLGYQPYGELPGILREIQVCLVPYRRTLLTHSCNPLKVFEYLATGRPIVSAPLDGLGATRTGVMLADTPDEFILAIEDALQRPDLGREHRLALARGNAWDARVDRLEEHLWEAVRAAASRNDSPRACRRRLAASRPARRWRRRARALSYRSLAAYALSGAAGWLYYLGRVAYRRVRGLQHPAVRRILLVRPNCYLGDLIAFLPTLQALRGRYPEARIVLSVHGMPCSSVLELAGSADEVRPLSDLTHVNARVRPLRAVRLVLEGFDLVISGAGYFLHRESLFSGAPYRLGLDEGDPLEALNTHVVPLDPTRHEAENNLALAELFSGPVAADARIPRVAVDEARVHESVDRLSAQLRLPPDAVLVTLHIGSKLPTRRWPVDRFAALATELLERCRELHVVFSGVADEASLVEAARQQISLELRSRTHSAAGLTDLTGLIGLLDGSAAVVSNDTGTMHLARARGRPLVALMGPENDLRWGPHPKGWGRAVSLRHQVPCAPCRRHTCDDLWCMRSLSVDEVLEQVWPMLDDRKDAEGMSRLERHVRRHGWSQLGAARMTPPLLTVVCWLEDPWSQAALRLSTSIARQDYPALEVVALTRQFVPAGLLATGFPIRVLALDGSTRHEAWTTALRAARGAVIVTAAGNVDWPSHHLGDRVARLVRLPTIGALDARGREVLGPIPTAGRREIAGRRDALLAWAEGAAAMALTPGLTRRAHRHP